MGLGNLLLLTQVTVFLLGVIFSLFMFIPISVNLNNFNGHCLLEAKGEWEQKDNQDVLHVTSWGQQANCNFPIFMGVVAFPTALFYVVWISLYLFRGTEP